MDDLNSLERDPLIEFYLKLSKSTEDEESHPEFNETYLRLAAKQIIGKMRRPESSIIEFYTKLLVIYYYQKYKSIESLRSIFKHLSEDEIDSVLKENRRSLIKQWNYLVEGSLSSYIHRSVFMKIIKEWTRRQVALFGDLDLQLLDQIASEITKYFGWSNRYVSSWLETCKASIGSDLLSSHDDRSDEDLLGNVEDALKVETIVEYLKDSIHPLALKEREDLFTVTTDSVHRANTAANGKQRTTSHGIVVLDNSPNMYVKTPNKKRQQSAEVLRNSSKKRRSNDNDTGNSIKTEDMELIWEDKNYSGASGNSNEDSEKVTSPADSPTEYNENCEDDGVVVNANTVKIPDDNSALDHLIALQAYFLNSGLYGALSHLDKIDSLLRERLTRKS